LCAIKCPFRLFTKAPQPDKAAILQVLKKQQSAWNKGNIDSFMTGYSNSPELRFVSKNGVRYCWQTVSDNYKKNYDTKEKMGELVFDIVSTELLNKENALVIGKWKVIANKTSEGYFSLWFKKIDGKWLIVLDHTS
jgi:hypothetical protein